MESSLRILHVYKDYFPVLGGIENHIRVLAEAQAAAGHIVTVSVCAQGLRSETCEIGGVTVIKSGRLMTAASMPISLAQPLAIGRLRPDLVHVHSPYPLGELSAWLLGGGAPIVATHHSDVVRQKGLLALYAPLLRGFLRSAGRILVTSGNYLESSPWLVPVRAKCAVVPLGVDQVRFVPATEPFAGQFTLLFAGRLRYYKGLDTLLRAMVQAPAASLRVCGDGPMRGAWEALTAELGLADRVHFLGEVDDGDLPGLYQRASVFVLPANARAEAFGTVLLEAMASGLPCVTTELGTGTSWLVQEGISGLVVPPRDPNALAGALNRLAADPQLCRRMGAAGRARVEAEFTERLMVDRVMAQYERVLGAP